MERNNKSTTPYYFCFAAGVYMAYILYRMFSRLEGAAEPRHWILTAVLGVIALAMITFGGYHVFFRKPEAAEPSQEGET